MKVHTALY